MEKLTLDCITKEDDFSTSFLDACRPVVIIGGARKMKAFERWTNSYLRSTLSGLRPTVRFKDGSLAFIPIESFLDYLESPEGFVSSRGPMYLTDLYLIPGFGDSRRDALAEDAKFPLYRGSAKYAEWISVYAGPSGTSTEFHQDIFSTHTWLAQLRGEKLWRICSPETDMPEQGRLSEIQVYEVTMKPGDLIYLPPNWWHEVVNLTPTLAISGNFCSFAEAENALVESLQSQSPQREVWIRTWKEILALQSPGR